MSRTIPTINTKRVILRGMRPEDFARFAQIWAKPDVCAHIGGEPRSKAASWDAFLRNAGHWQITGFGQWGVQVHGVQDLAGQVGFFFGSRALGEDFDTYPEAGWVLDSQVQGQGLGLDAVQAAHDWFDRIVAGPTVCMIAPENEPSLRIADRLGYRPLRDVELPTGTTHLMMRKGPPV